MAYRRDSGFRCAKPIR